MWGPNSTANNLQNQELLATGQLLSWNGPKNYIANSSFENQSTTGYSLGTTGTLTNGLPTGAPTFGSGTTSLAISIVTSGQIAGLASLAYTASAATTAGNMLASSAFSIDAEDQASVLSFSVSYSVPSGASTGVFNTTSSASFGIAFYDVTNSAWIYPPSSFVFNQITGVGKATGTIQLAATTASLRMVIYNANATTGAITLYFDDIFVGPSSIGQNGQVISWNGTQSSQAVTANVTDLAFTTVHDSSAAWNGTQYVVPVAGTYVAAFGGTTNGTVAASIWINGVSYSLGSTGASGTFINASAVMPNLKPGDLISVRFSQTVTITVGNFGVVQVANAGVGPAGQVVASSARVSSGASTANTSPINFDTIDFDSSGSITTGVGTWQYKAPFSGYYAVCSTVYFGSTNAVSAIFKNGSALTNLNVSNSGTNAAAGAVVIQLNAGDTIQIRPNTTVTPTSFGGLTTAQSNYINIFLLQGPSSQQQAASVNARYFASATSISGTLATVVWTTKDYDSANGMSSGVYTIPISGKYQINSSLAISGTFALNGTADMQIQKNGTVVSEDNFVAGGANTSIAINCSDIINCLAGDLIKVQVSTSASGPAIVSSNSKNFFSIARVGS